MERIEQFMEKYWKWPTLDLEKNRDEQIEEEEKFMLKKYGKETIEKRNIIVQEYCNCPGEQEQEFRDRMTEFDYTAGICEDAYLDPNLRSKKTLETLLSFFSSLEDDLTIVDAGCGDGKITLGMAACLDNLKRIYALDKKQAAINRFRSIINDSQLPDKTIDKIILAKGDYTDETVQQELAKIGKIDYVLLLYSFPTVMMTSNNSNMEFAIPHYRNINSWGRLLLSEGGSLLIGHELNPLALIQRAGYDKKESIELVNKESVLNGLNERYNYLLQLVGSIAGIEFRNISFRKIVPDLIIAMNVGKIRKRGGNKNGKLEY